MKIYTYSRARQQLASLLKEASRQGRVQIRRRDGSVFEVSPARSVKSALEVPGLATSVTAEEIVSVVRASRRRGIRSGLPNNALNPTAPRVTALAKRRKRRATRPAG